jgi:RsiW-degrading membrane proteinase PrsW (M82 family)
MGERILVPAIGVSVFAALTGGFMFTVGGATARIRRIWIASVFFMLCFGYSVFWQDKLEGITGWQPTYIVVIAISFGLALLLHRLLTRRVSQRESVSNTV